MLRDLRGIVLSSKMQTASRWITRERERGKRYIKFHPKNIYSSDESK